MSPNLRETSDLMSDWLRYERDFVVMAIYAKGIYKTGSYSLSNSQFSSANPGSLSEETSSKSLQHPAGAMESLHFHKTVGNRPFKCKIKLCKNSRHRLRKTLPCCFTCSVTFSGLGENRSASVPV